MLILMRHADAVAMPGAPDHDRPLSARGEQDASAMGRWLRDNGPGIIEIKCSTAARARRTCELVMSQLRQAPTATYDAALYRAGCEDLLDVARTAGADRVLLVIGHNPAVAQAADALADEPLPRFPAGAVAVFDLEAGGSGLVAFATP